MLTLLLRSSCVCESSSPSAFSSSSPAAALHHDYVQWAGDAIGTCVYKDSVFDIASLAAIIVHAVLWSVLIFPQLRLNYSLKSASNLSLLYLSFWLASEVSFVIATVLERWSWMWVALRSIRVGMCALLLLQTIYYKFYYHNEYTPAVRPGDSRRYWKQRDLEGGVEEEEYDSDCDDGSMLQPYDESGMITTLGKWPVRKPRRKSTASSSETGQLNPISLDRYGSHHSSSSHHLHAAGGSSNSILGGGGSSTHIGSYAGVGPSSLHSSASGISNGQGGIRKSSQRYGTSVTSTQQISWGEALLGDGSGGTPPRPMTDISSSSTTANTRTSRLPSSHAHLVSATPPRTISPMNTPLFHPAASSSSHVQVSVMPNVDNDRRRASYMATHQGQQQQQQQPTLQPQKSLSSNVAFHASPPSPSHNAQSGATFHTSPSSAFTAILPSRSASSDDPTEEENIWDQPTPTEEDHLATHTPNPASSSSTAASSSSSSQPRTSNGPKSNMRLFSVGLCIMGLTYWSVGGGIQQHAASSSSSSSPSSSSSDISHPSGRVLLSLPSFTPPSPSSSYSSSFFHPSSSPVLPVVVVIPPASSPSPSSPLNLNDTNTTVPTTAAFCNEPYNAQPPVSILIRIFNWLGCVLAAMSFFPQYIYIDSYYHSTHGLSYLMYTLQLIGNLTLLLGFSIPEHNDFLSNYYNSQDSAFESWYLNQVIIPEMITNAFNFLQIWVLVVQRRKWMSEKEDQYER